MRKRNIGKFIKGAVLDLAGQAVKL